MFDDSNITRTAKTEDEYMHRSKLLFDQYHNDTNQLWENDPIQFCHWLIAHSVEKKWSRATVKSYKAALKFVMECYGFTDVVDRLSTIDSSDYSSKGKSTSSNKKKSFSEQDVAQIESEINTARKWDELLLFWIKAGIITGLRPSEWSSAKLVISTEDKAVEQWGELEENNTGHWLIIKNAKDTNNRANGIYRALDLSQLNIQELKIIKSMLVQIQKQSLEFKAVYNGCRNRLSEITKKFRPRRNKRPSLYSARHQFRANASSSKQTLEQLAALMGHATNETASKYYGYARLGSGRQPLRPHPDNVATVSSVYVPRDRVKASSGLKM